MPRAKSTATSTAKKATEAPATAPTPAAAVKPPGQTTPAPKRGDTYRTLDDLHAALAAATGYTDHQIVWANAAKVQLFVVRKHRPAGCPVCTGR